MAYDGVEGGKAFLTGRFGPADVKHKVKRPPVPQLGGNLLGRTTIPFGQRAAEKVVKDRRDSMNPFDRFYYNARTGGSVAIDYETNLASRRLLKPGEIRTGYGSLAVFQSQSTSAKRLSREAWPTVAGRPAWPSSPTFVEWLEMIRRGAKSSSDHWKPAGMTRRVSLRDFNENIELARRIVVRQIIGLRADIEVERKFLKYFRYRWGFLILISTSIPAGLVRKLATIWLGDPYSLWLEGRVSLKKFLRQVPISVINRAALKRAPVEAVLLAGVKHSPFTKDASETSDYESVGSDELD